jgi:small-conductance mechanosensitive channel
LKTEYFGKVLFAALLISPVVISIPLFLTVNFFWVNGILIILMWYILMRKYVFFVSPDQSESVDAYEIFEPIIVVFVYYALVWIIFFGASGYLMKGNGNELFFALTLPYFHLS